jgi:hypothetical protein
LPVLPAEARPARGWDDEWLKLVKPSYIGMRKNFYDRSDHFPVVKNDQRQKPETTLTCLADPPAKIHESIVKLCNFCAFVNPLKFLEPFTGMV